MSKTIAVLIFCAAEMISAKEGIAGIYDYLEPKASEAVIDRGCVEVPLGTILLIRKDSHYCALKFIRYWTEIDEKQKEKNAPYEARGGIEAELARERYTKKYAAYEVFYQGDGSGDFLRNNVVKSEHIASWLPLKGPFRPFIYQPGDSYVKCGPYRLVWRYKKRVCFIPTGKGEGDFGFELAPTPWTEISQVNVFDPRVKWYRYDEKRERVFIPIDKLWENKGK
jgi:hypothetical protein